MGAAEIGQTASGRPHTLIGEGEGWETLGEGQEAKGNDEILMQQQVLINETHIYERRPADHSGCLLTPATLLPLRLG